MLRQTSDLLTDQVPMKAVLRFTMTVNGEQCVMMSSLQQMEMLFAGSWGTHQCKYSIKERYQVMVVLWLLLIIA